MARNINICHNTMDVVLEGTLVPHETSPLATSPIAIPGELDTRSKYPEGGPRTQRLPRLQVPIDAGSSERAWSAYFPASGIRGHLRRIARSIFHVHYGQDMDIDELRYLTIGGIKGSASEPSFNLANAQALRERLPLISLFGATSDLGHGWVSGKLCVHHAIPTSPLTPQIINGVRSDDLCRDPMETHFLSEEAAKTLTQRANAERRASALRRIKKEASRELAAAKRSKDQDARKAAEARIIDIEAQLETLSNSIGTDVSVQMPLDGYEVISPGTTLNHMFRLQGATPAELGLFLMTLEEWAYTQGLGAHTNHGCGVIHGNWDVRVREELGSTFEPAGRINLKPFDHTAFEGRIQELYVDCRDAFLDSIQSIKDRPLREVLQA